MRENRKGEVRVTGEREREREKDLETNATLFLALITDLYIIHILFYKSRNNLFICKGNKKYIIYIKTNYK